ncbi:MAG: Lrp/AsnC ligand binding domain-containing protein [Oscillospiraceae bacterium]|nr:Lrp/AsnC ligand binding domain-containing protein [Oscillospiraceae bacterium]
MVTAYIQVKVTPAAIVGYKGIAETISQFREVKSIYLMSGQFDLALMVECESLREAGLFVAEKLSAIEGVLDISTHFIIERYKEDGELLTETDERGIYNA